MEFAGKEITDLALARKVNMVPVGLVAQAAGIAAYNASLLAQPTQQELEARLDARADAAQTALEALDNEGRWVNADGWLYSWDFVQHFNALTDYLEAHNALELIGDLPGQGRALDLQVLDAPHKRQGTR